MAAYEYFFNLFILKSTNHSMDEGFRGYVTRDAISETGALPCFCMKEKERGAPANKIYSGADFNMKYEKPLCRDQRRYMSLLGVPQIMYYSASVFILMQSLLARAFFAFLTNLTSFKTETARIRFMTISVFMIFFFNYGIMYILAPINIDTEFMHTFFAGIYTDLGTHWFNDIGGLIVLNQMIVSVMPPITVAVNWLINYFLLCYDQRKCKPSQT